MREVEREFAAQGVGEQVTGSTPIYIVGSGIVGTATGRAFESVGYDVRYVESQPAKVAAMIAAGKCASSSLKLGSEATSFIFICVPTPAGPQGYDLTSLRTALVTVGEEIARSTGFHTVVTRSTVPPLTWRRVVIPTLEAASQKRHGSAFAVASAPEFLRQVTANADALAPRVSVVAAEDESVRESLAELFRPLGGLIRALDDPTVAEVIKLANNCYNAAKISFSNEIWKICEHLGISQELVGDVVSQSAEGSYNPSYGIVGGYPYGGACLPKDLDGLLAFGADEGVDLPLLTAVREVNLQMASDRLGDLPLLSEAVNQ